MASTKVLSALLLLVFCGITRPSLAAAPNILFIAIDDLNDWVGCLGGHPQAQTPNIDQLASQGVNFANAHCQAPICNCSRVSMLLGKLPSTTGMYFLSPNFRNADRTKNETTLFEYFRRHGYYTSTRGKIFHGDPDRPSFDHIEPTSGWRRSKKKLSYKVPGSNALWDWGQVDVPDPEHMDYQTADWAASELPKLAEKQQPFALAVGFSLPHVPIYASRKWFDLYPLDTLKLPAALADDQADIGDYARNLTLNLTCPRQTWMVEHNEWNHAVQAYLASVSFVDSLVGTLVNSLKSTSASENTIVVLWSDHGFHLGEKHRWGKRTLWEETTRVPLIFSGPDICANITCTKPVGLIDVYPTLAELCQLPPKKDLEGTSLVPLLRDQDVTWDRPAITTFGPNNHSVRSEHWRYIRYSDGSEELYNHQSDSHEWTNLAQNPENAEVIAQHQKWLPKINAEPLPGSKGSDSPLYGE